MNEFVEVYVIILGRLVRICNYGVLIDLVIFYRIVVSINDNLVCKKFL